MAHILITLPDEDKACLAASDKRNLIEQIERLCGPQSQATWNPTIYTSEAKGKGGTFKIICGSGSSDPVPYDANNAEVQAAFETAVERSRSREEG